MTSHGNIQKQSLTGHPGGRPLACHPAPPIRAPASPLQEGARNRRDGRIAGILTRGDHRSTPAAHDQVGDRLPGGRAAFGPPRVHDAASRAEPDHGIVFRRTDLGIDLPARFDWVVGHQLCTSSASPDQPEAQIGTVEHLMAALAGCGVDNCWSRSTARSCRSWTARRLRSCSCSIAPASWSRTPPRPVIEVCARSASRTARLSPNCGRARPASTWRSRSSSTRARSAVRRSRCG